jgi:hypothetical protein
MNTIDYYESEFVKIHIEEINKADIIILRIKKNESTQEEWDGFLEVFRSYYEVRLKQTKQKYIMMVRVEDMSMLSLTKIKQFVKILKDNEEIVKECAIYTVFIVNSSIVKQIFNFALTFYKNKKPVFFKTDYENVYKEIHNQITE